MNAAYDPLHGLCVLIVEDETLVAMLVEEYLLELGCKVVLSASRVAKAMKGLQTCPVDVAVLDVNVAGENIARLADLLDQRGIPLVFASGYGARGVDARWCDSPVLQKPFTGADLRRALLDLLDNREAHIRRGTKPVSQRAVLPMGGPSAPIKPNFTINCNHGS